MAADGSLADATAAELSAEFGLDPSALRLIQHQLKSLVAASTQLGLPARAFARLAGNEIRAAIEEPAKGGYATPEEGLAKLLNAEGGCVDGAEAAALFRRPEPVTRQALTERIRNGDIVAYKTSGGQYRIPRWQFRPEGGVLPGLAEAVAILRKDPSFEALTPFAFFLQVHPLTPGHTPLEALRQGNLNDVLQAAESERG
ncbi:MAG TPA: hypothetical protein PLN52_15075 [Opitutaceae bacterium]|nr:hypothetical protein [Opitutaceae bacterium]